MSHNPLRELADKAKKFKHSGHELQHDVSKDLTEDKGDMAQIHEIGNDSRTLARHVKKDGKTVESSGSVDAQQSGLFEKTAKKAGDKDPTFTSSEMAAAQAGIKSHKTQGKMGEAESPLKEKLDKSKDENPTWDELVSHGKRQVSKGHHPKKVAESLAAKLGLDDTDHNRLLSHISSDGSAVSNTKSLIDAVKRLTSGPRPSYDPKVAGKEVADQVRAMIGKKKLEKAPKTLKIDPNQVPGAKKEPPTIDYSKMNKPKNTEANAPVIDYGNMPPKQPNAPLWQRNAAVQREQKLKTIADKHPDVIVNTKEHSAPAKAGAVIPKGPAVPPKPQAPAPAVKQEQKQFIHSDHLKQKATAAAAIQPPAAPAPKKDHVETALQHIDALAAVKRKQK